MNLNIYRGDNFRVSFSKIGELRSLLPDKVSIMGLTATATTETLKIVTDRLSMRNPVVIGITPNQVNLKFFVEPLPTATTLCDTLSDGLKTLRLDFPKTLVFCCTLGNCSTLYQLLRAKLGKEFTEPIGYPDLHQFRMVEMFTRASTKEMKEKVLKSFVDVQSKLRLVVATTAFSMGIDCPNVRNIVHFGVPGTIEQYIQEVGRAGRDGEPSTALLLYGSPGKHVEHNMKRYGENNMKCRRQFLYKDFLFYDHTDQTESNCCDICDNKKLLI